MNPRLERLIDRLGAAYVRSLIAAEAAVLQGDFTLAKVLRATGCAQRSMAMRLLRLKSGSDSAAALRTALSDLRELEVAVQELNVPDEATRATLEQIAQSARRAEALASGALASRNAHGAVLDSYISETVWVCLRCGATTFGTLPDTCPVCGTLGTDFEWFGPFYTKTPERLGSMLPEEIIVTLEATPQKVATLISGVPDAALSHAPSDEQWSVKEIVGHLIETDRLFVAGVILRLERDDKPALVSALPPWRTHEGKGYESRPIDELLEEWEKTRAATLEIVRALTPEQWTRQGMVGANPVAILDSGIWLANHDLGHLAQIRRLCKT